MRKFCGFLGILCLAFSQQLVLANTPVRASASNALEKYVIRLDACTFEITGNAEAHISIPDGIGVAGFSELGGPKGGGLIFTLHCFEKQENYCLNDWANSLKDEDPSTLKIMKVHTYRNFHPAYQSIAYAENTNAVPTPRPRSVRFCVNEGTRVIDGRVTVGTEISAKTRYALNILKTLKFLPLEK